MTFISLGIGSLWRVPLQTLRRRRLALTIQTAVASGTYAQIAFASQDRQMADQDRFIESVRLSQVPPTLATLGSLSAIM